MEDSNYVKISTNEYNILRDFKNNIDNGLTVHVRHGRLYHGVVYSTDVTVREIMKVLDAERDEHGKIKILLDESGYLDKFGFAISEVKKMNIFQFIKWKRRK